MGDSGRDHSPNRQNGNHVVTETRSTGRIPRVIWVGLAAAAFYVLLAAVGGNLLSALANGDETLDFALGHLIVLPILIAAGLLFIRRAGWTRQVWRSSSPFTERRRWWMLAIPVVSYLFEDLGILAIAINTLAVALDGALLYGAYRATGTLWVPILLHGLGDFGRFLQPGDDRDTHAAMSTGDTIASVTFFIGAALVVALVVSFALQNRRDRRRDTAASPTAS